MLPINEENIKKDLDTLIEKLNEATLESCIDTLQLLTKSINFLKDKRSPNDNDEDWNNYSRIIFRLGKYFSGVIRLYNDRFNLIVSQQCEILKNKFDDCTRDTTYVNYNSNYKRNDNRNDNGNINKSNNNNNNGFNNNSYRTGYPSPLNTIGNNLKHNPTYHSDIKNDIQQNNNDDINNIIVRRNTESALTRGDIPQSLSSVKYTGNTEVNNTFEGGIFEYISSPSLLSSSYDSIHESIHESINESIYENDYVDNSNAFGVIYECVKEFIAKEDYQIDLQIGDIVTINQFTGKYIFGENSRTGDEGLYPIYYIERLDGNPIFFRCIEEMEDASVNDEIFIIQKANGEYKNNPGYNITKNAPGFFNLSKLEPILLDEMEKNHYEKLYEGSDSDDNDSVVPRRSQTYTPDSSNVNSNNLVNSVRPSNTVPGNISNNENNGYIDYKNKCVIRPEDIEDEDFQSKQQKIMEKLLEFSLNTISEDENNGNNKDRIQDIIKKIKKIQNNKNENDNEKKFRDIDKKIKAKKDISEKKDLEQLRRIKKIVEVFEKPETREEAWIKNRFKCEEMREREENFCKKMKILLEKFKEPLEQAVGTENEMLNKIQIHKIFKYIPDIYEFNKKLSEELKEAVKRYDEEGAAPIAEVFIKRVSDWQIYIKYVENYSRARETIENLEIIEKTPKSKRFNSFIENRQKSKECNRSNLKELIFLPIQHFLKYNLFFKDILENTDPRVKCYDELNTVYDYIIQLGEIMEVVRLEQKRLTKLFSLSSLVYDFPLELISHKRTYIDVWEIKDTSKNKKQKLVLLSDVVVFVDIKKKDKYDYVFDQTLEILNYDIEIVTNDKNKFIKFNDNGSGKTENTNRNQLRENTIIGGITRILTTKSISMVKILKFESDKECDNFFKSYNEQKEIMKNNKNKNNNDINNNDDNNRNCNNSL